MFTVLAEFSHKMIIVHRDFNPWAVERYIIFVTSRWHEGTKSVVL